jgi:hypothetical protein
MGVKRVLAHLFVLLVIYTMKGNVTIGWDAVPYVVDHYEVKLIREVTGEEHTYGTTALRITIPKPRSGKWEVRVRSCVKNPDGSFVYSEECSSLNPACAMLSDGVTHGDWKVYWKPSSPLLMTVE